MRELAVAVGAIVLVFGLAGCIGDSATDADREDPLASNSTANASLAATNATTARTDCFGEGIGGVPCFEATVAVDPEDRIFAAVSVCQKIARSTDGGASFEALDLPPLPPAAPEETTTAPGDCTLQIGPDGSLWFSAYTFQDRLADPPGVDVPNHYGIQVARSNDGGESWSVNTWAAKASRHPVPGIHPDRQWLSFGEGNRVYLTFYDTYQDVDKSWIAVSEDGGESFGPFRPMPGLLPGDPVAEGNGTLHVPYIDGSGEGYTVHVSTSTDAGESFETTTVHDAASGGKVWWPDLASGPDGRLYITWTDGESVFVARSNGQGAWAAPLTWNSPAPNATGAAPGLEVHDGLVDVVWYRGIGEDRQAYVLGRVPVDAWNASAVEVHTLDRFNASTPVTHFADLAVAPSGDGVFAWTDPDQGMLVAREIDLQNATGRGAGSP